MSNKEKIIDLFYNEHLKPADIALELYVRLVFSNFLILPFTKVGVTLENSHINSSRCFRHSSNSNSCLIIFTSNTILSFWMAIFAIKKYHPFQNDICIYLFYKKFEQIRRWCR